jgi:hypothetical protein
MFSNESDSAALAPLLVLLTCYASVAEQLDRWLADIAPTRSAYTVKEHRRCVEHGIRPALGPVRLDKLTARQLTTSTTT